MIVLICISRMDIFSGNSLVSVLAANILMTAYRNKTRWPDIFVRVYIEDAMGERVWVDHPESKPFVDNICTAFDTKIPTQNQFASGGFFVGSGGSTGNTTKSSGTKNYSTIEILSIRTRRFQKEITNCKDFEAVNSNNRKY